MMKQLPDFSKAAVMIVGDCVLDRYWFGESSRISPEAPVPVVVVRRTEERPGGAGNVAMNVSALGGQASLFALVGEDEASATLEKQLIAAKVTPYLYRLATHPTIVKLRVVSRHQQMVRLDFEEQLSAFDSAEFLTCCETHFSKANVLILSDYGKGTLLFSKELITAANKKGLRVFVDPKSADFSKYHGAYCITPNLSEFEQVVGPSRGLAEMQEKAERLMRDHAIESILVTRSEQGMTLFKIDKSPMHLPARARDVFDVTGAGDTVIATLAAAVSCGESLEQAMIFANVAAGIAVTKFGSATVTVAELQAELHETPSPSKGIVTEEELLKIVNLAKQRHETIVMTNGCFDLLHPGHVAYLKAARALGDRLIVAVNADESVQTLKGSSRPVNPLLHRMTLLASLEMVDWVVPFSEETPERLITRVLPDILVKGGDYTVTQIAGHQAVLAHGGEVRVLSFLPGYSTTSMIERIKKE